MAYAACYVIGGSTYMNVKGLRKNILQDYLIWGFAFSVLLTLIGYGCDGYAQVIFAIIFCVISGFIGNLIVFSQFVRRYYVYLLITLIWVIYFAVKGGEQFICPCFVQGIEIE